MQALNGSGDPNTRFHLTWRVGLVLKCAISPFNE
jgi:hypothetical protein